MAATRNDMALRMNAKSRPKSDAVMPPNAEPTIAMIPHVEPLSALAGNSSALLTMLGILAELAGTKNDASVISRMQARYASQTELASRTSRNNNAAAAANTLTTIISLRRSNRSVTGPAM